MNYLGIILGNRNVKTLSRADVHEAFINSFMDSVFMSVGFMFQLPQLMLNFLGPKV